MRKLKLHFAAMATKPQRTHLQRCDWREANAPAGRLRKSNTLTHGITQLSTPPRLWHCQFLPTGTQRIYEY